MDGKNERFTGETNAGRYSYGRVLTVGYRADYNENGAIVGGEYVAEFTDDLPADAVSDEIAASLLAAVMRRLIDCGITPTGFQRAIIELMGSMGDEVG